MRILVTGATGFVGKHLAAGLQNTTHTLIVLVRDETKFQPLPGKNDSIVVISTGESNWKTLVREADPEMVIHLAAFLSSGDNETAIESLIDANLLFSTHLLDSLRETSVKYFINTGTFAEYLNNDGILKPAYLYAATKSAFRSILSMLYHIPSTAISRFRKK
jgi:CDP-paratose synthetase